MAEVPKKKLIEVALPLDAINAASAREKSIRHGHPSTLHLWWARRPLATARAVIWASLVDDPSSHPELFPTEEDQDAERKRLFDILEKLVVWENSNNQEILEAAKAEIIKSTDGNPPEFLDPFAGGGSIPLEAQRLGLKVHAHDLNPVAVMINKAMIEIPPKFAGQPPINPAAQTRLDMGGGLWERAKGLAEDVRYYGEWMKQEAFKRIGHLYPTVTDESGKERTVIAWIWTRTVKCPNPACGCEMPLASSFALSKKKGHEAYIIPEFDSTNKKITYGVHVGEGEIPASGKTSRGAKFKCIICGEPVSSDYIKEEGSRGSIAAQLMAIVAEGENGRLYLSPTQSQEEIAGVEKPASSPTGEIGGDRRALWTPLYGLTEFTHLFTNRQLTALTTFSDLVKEAQQQIVKDGGSEDYARAVGVYLAFVVDKLADYHSSICSWHAPGQKMRNTFGRQAIPMVWDYAECNPFSSSSGSYGNMLGWVYESILNFPSAGEVGTAPQAAQDDAGTRNVMISTDPPYYDNIGYADLSDYFYVWMRQSLKDEYPDLFQTLLTPKKEELVATPYRFNGSVQKAREFFESGMLEVCTRMYQYAREDIPVTIYYAYKQSETKAEKTASSGWETMLTAIITAGFNITGTWPVRTEMANRSIAGGSNALASSIVLVCRKRPMDAVPTTRRNFINELKRELRPALEKLQQSNIAPVDLAQSAIGPGMGVFSKYSQVLQADGEPMSVRSALESINQELDLFLNEQSGFMDPDSRFCVDLYTQNAFSEMKYGEADVLARAKNTSVDIMADKGMLSAKRGIVRLLRRDEISENLSKEMDGSIWLLTQRLTRDMETGGIAACAEIVADSFGSMAEQAKALAYRLYTIADRKGWSQEAYAYNSLVTAWPEIQEKAAAIKNTTKRQLSML